jgi:hypothetical protein
LLSIFGKMCKYVDRMLQMQDGKLVQVIEDKDEIEMLARVGLAVEISEGKQKPSR